MQGYRGFSRIVKDIWISFEISGFSKRISSCYSRFLGLIFISNLRILGFRLRFRDSRGISLWISGIREPDFRILTKIVQHSGGD